MPINVREANELDLHFKRFLDAKPADRAAQLRRLFMENLAIGCVHLKPGNNIELPAYGEGVATLGGVHVVFIGLATGETDRVRKLEAMATAKGVSAELHNDDMLLLMSNTSSTQLHFIRPTLTANNPSPRHMVIEKDMSRRTAVTQLERCFWSGRAPRATRPR